MLRKLIFVKIKVRFYFLESRLCTFISILLFFWIITVLRGCESLLVIIGYLGIEFWFCRFLVDRYIIKLYK